MKKSFTLIEVLMFVTIISMVFVSALAVATYALRVMIFNQHKILAAHYAEEGLEWIKSEKEADWHAFVIFSSPSGSTYCITTPDTANSGPCNGSYFLGNPNIFSREMILTSRGNPVEQVDIQIRVYWPEGNQNSEVIVKSNLKLIE